MIENSTKSSGVSGISDVDRIASLQRERDVFEQSWLSTADREAALQRENEEQKETINRLVVLKDRLVIDCRANKDEADVFQSRLAKAEAALEKAVSELADPMQWNWMRGVISERHAADRVLALLDTVELIEQLHHPLGGLAWRVNDKLYGRTEGLDAALAAPTAEEEDKE